MAKAIMNARIYLGATDLSGVANAVAINLKTDIVDCTAFSDAMKDKLAGLTDVIVDASGYFSPTEDLAMFNQLALANAILAVATPTGAFGDLAYFFRPLMAQYTPLEGKVSEMGTFKLHGEGAAPLVRGRILAAKAARVATGYGTKYNLGAYAADQILYGGLLVFSASAGDTLDVTICIADRVQTITINAPGTGYTAGHDLTIVQAGGSLATANIDTVDGGGGVTGVTLLTPGSGYAVANALDTTVSPGPGGSGCKLNITAITDTPVITFAQKAAAGYEWATDAGPITDVNFKAKWTIGGVDPSFTFAVVAGIV